MALLNYFAITMVLTLSFSPTVLSQSDTGQDNGTIQGFVTCFDGRYPARFATINVVPLDRGASRTSKTSLSGSFRIPDVASGRYLIFAEYPGYISPKYTLSNELMVVSRLNPAESNDFIRRHSLTEVDVVGGQITSVALNLERGASISGSVSFDDGALGPKLVVEILQTTDQRATPILIKSGVTDDNGDFFVSGIPRGHYIVRVILQDPANSPVYFGDTWNLKQAKVIDLSAHENLNGIAITISTRIQQTDLEH